MKSFELTSKIVWRKEAVGDIEKNFYPSFYKKIIKKESFFKENFEVKIVKADKENLKSIFIPFYEKEVKSRNDFVLSRENISNEIIQKAESKCDYWMLLAYYHGELFLATLFSIKNEGLFFAYRVFKRDVEEKSFLHGATVSYWGEKLIYEYGLGKGVKFFSRGRDSHPFIGKTRIGLPLYKLKTGMKPMRPLVENSFEEKEYEEKFFIEKSEPALFFCNENENKFYKDVYLYYPANSLERSFVKEFEEVIKWSGLNFYPVEF